MTISILHDYKNVQLLYMTPRDCMHHGNPPSRSLHPREKPSQRANHRSPICLTFAQDFSWPAPINNYHFVRNARNTPGRRHIMHRFRDGDELSRAVKPATRSSSLAVVVSCRARRAGRSVRATREWHAIYSCPPTEQCEEAGPETPACQSCVCIVPVMVIFFLYFTSRTDYLDSWKPLSVRTRSCV